MIYDVIVKVLCNATLRVDAANEAEASAIVQAAIDGGLATQRSLLASNDYPDGEPFDIVSIIDVEDVEEGIA